MSSPNRTTNDMYEDIREGTSGTRNEGNNYNILLTYIENIKIELYLSISLVFVSLYSVIHVLHLTLQCTQLFEACTFVHFYK